MSQTTVDFNVDLNDDLNVDALWWHTNTNKQTNKTSTWLLKLITLTLILERGSFKKPKFH